MSNMASVIVPKSDQINADDLLSGPITITITDVTVKPTQEQPVSIHFEGSDKAYRPCKSMARVLVAAWGPDAAKYKGRSLTLYCDPKVRWGGMEVGGIRISHMSHIDSAITMALTVTRGNKKPFTVKPLTNAPAAQSGGTPDGDTLKKITAALEFANETTTKKFQAMVETYDVTSVEDLNDDAQRQALKWLNAQIDKQPVTT